MYNFDCKKAFTLVEVMITVAVLSFGAVMLYQAFFTSFDAVQYASNRIKAQLWADSVIEEEKILEETTPMILSKTEAGSVILNNRKFLWQKSIQPIDLNLYAMTIELSWKEGARTRFLSRAAYLIC